MDPEIALDNALHAPTLPEREEAAESFLRWADSGGALPPGLTPGTLGRLRAMLTDRARRHRRNALARQRRAVLRDVADACGLTVVRGAVSGRLYLE